MIDHLSTWYAWVVFLSAACTLCVSALALVSRGYHETLLENIALCAALLASVVVLLQLDAYGCSQPSGTAFYCASGALYAVAKVAKARTCDPGGGGQGSVFSEETRP